MTQAPIASPVSGGIDVEDALARLDRAITAAETLGIPAGDAQAVRVEADARLGFPGDVYVLALVGGTGVGKSSLLNGLAGEPISPASVRRPTTDEAVAWVPREAGNGVAALLDWLGVHAVREHESGPGNVAILDLPDMDSVEAVHRERVEAVLPKVDAVVWVTDPEKYHDAVLYDDFLREWIPRLDRQAIVLNKIDRLSEAEIDQVRRDLEDDLRTIVTAPGRAPTVLATSAVRGPDGLGEFRSWLEAGIEAKRIVRGRIQASVRTMVERLAREAGVGGGEAVMPVVGSSARERALRAVTAAVLQAIDLPGVERRAIAATRASARARGTGPIGLLTSTLYRLSGRESRVADPDAYLLRWREHGPLAPAAEAVRRTVHDALVGVPSRVRPTYAAAVEPTAVERRLGLAVDTALGRQDRDVPSSRVWPVLGALQTLTTGAIVLSVAWIVIWVLARPPVDNVVLPIVGSVPVPFVALAVSLVAGYLLARILGWHAGWLGRRWAGRLRRGISAAIERELSECAFEPLDSLEVARSELAAASQR